MPASIKRLDDRLVGIAFLAFVVDDALTGKPRRRLGKSAILVDGIRDRRIDPAIFQFDAICDPDLEVFAAVSWRGMDETGAVLVGDVIARKQRHREVVTDPTLQADDRKSCRRVRRPSTARIFSKVVTRACLKTASAQLVCENKEIAVFRPVVGRRVSDFDKDRNKSSAKN